MMKIYYTNTRAIVGDEYTREFYYTTKEEAQIIAKSMKSSISRRENLAYAAEILLGSGWKEVKP